MVTALKSQRNGFHKLLASSWIPIKFYCHLVNMLLCIIITMPLPLGSAPLAVKPSKINFNHPPFPNTSAVALVLRARKSNSWQSDREKLFLKAGNTSRRKGEWKPPILVESTIMWLGYTAYTIIYHSATDFHKQLLKEDLATTLVMSTQWPASCDCRVSSSVSNGFP
jgi:hypothetical protein